MGCYACGHSERPLPQGPHPLGSTRRAGARSCQAAPASPLSVGRRHSSSSAPSSHRSRCHIALRAAAGSRSLMPGTSTYRATEIRPILAYMRVWEV
eukprot:351456-Chlamydomonas_euryale.AAC.1